MRVLILFDKKRPLKQWGLRYQVQAAARQLIEWSNDVITFGTKAKEPDLVAFAVRPDNDAYRRLKAYGQFDVVLVDGSVPRAFANELCTSARCFHLK